MLPAQNYIPFPAVLMDVNVVFLSLSMLEGHARITSSASHHSWCGTASCYFVYHTVCKYL